MTEIEQLFSLRGHRALITGGSSGLGAEMAAGLAGAGAEVVLVARRQERLDQVAARVRDTQGRAETVAADIATDEGLDRVVRVARSFATPVDILVNAAGLNVRKPPEELSRAEWDATVHLNLSVPFFLARDLVDPMIDAGWGRIINIASLQSVRAFPNSAPYGASKGGVIQLTRAMAEAWSSKGVNSNAIAPGLFPTELTETLFESPELVDAMAARTCLGRNGQLPDIRGAAVFLASPAAAFITGQTLFVDGGLTAK